MRYKVVPGPAEYDLLVATRDALPLVPGSVEDCCTRIRDRTAVPSRDEAREWLTFLTALELAAQTDRGFHRLRDDPSREALAEPFEANVFGVREISDALDAADDPLAPAAVFDRVRDIVPRWERNRYPDWEDEWQSRIELVLSWGLIFGVVEGQDGRYS